MKRGLIALAAFFLLLIPAAAFAAEKPAEAPAAELRSGLDQLLSEHFVLAVMSMTKEYEGAPDAEQVQAALQQNAEDMVPAIEKLYGKEGAEQFGKIFGSHNGYTKSLAMAAKQKDQQAAAEAKDDINQFTKEFSVFLEKATGGKLTKETAKKALLAHEEDVQKTFESYAEGDYKQAYQSFREGFGRMFTISKALSGAITAQMPEKFASSDTKAADLRSSLSSLTAEHTALAALGLQKGYDGAADYDFVNWAEDQHTMDFKKTISAIYGNKAGMQFEKIWQSDHIIAQGELAAAAAEGDQQKEQAAKGKLMNFSKKFGTFLSEATGERLSEKDAQAAILKHENSIIKAFDNYVSKDYAASYRSFREGYAFMFEAAKTLSNAIASQMPDKYTGSSSSMPSGMPKTGFGGASQSEEASRSLSLMAVSLTALVILTAGVLYQKRHSFRKMS
ncbi:copper amine oxidase [Metabacillus sp. GX 13764]|uniref:copper amine oxidase n=1 Tax=Metabacillus kandeliae TaxID=2900151 RepID=UPI001E32C31D|nr:copper amine oxidase [Metabacillus kandeliae]MCD7035778.1 copper amine oxidase [Metabacillus kandeliae]